MVIYETEKHDDYQLLYS